jgi:pilus assembly protein CpaE
MTVLSPNEASRSWQASKKEPAVQLYLSGVEGDSAALVGTRVGGFPLSLNLIAATDWIDPQELGSAAAAIVQVDPAAPTSVKRFQKLAASVPTPLIAAVYDPPLALVRSLVRAGAHDVVPLPLNIEDLETSLAPLRDELAKAKTSATTANGKLVSVIKAMGGVGATAITGQLAIRYAQSEAARGRETCLLDLDVQFGDAAFQLGLQPRLSLLDLLEAGSRLDGDLLRGTTCDHASGLKVVAAPPEMMPLEGVSNDHLMQIVELATREFSTVFVDLPTNWSNWSLSVVARSNLVVLITEMTVAGINRAKRQLSLLESQDLNNLDVRIVMNRFEKSQTRLVRPSDVREALGRDIAYTIGNDFELVRSAIDQGIPISDIRRKSAVGKDLDLLNAGLAAALNLER